MFPIYHVRMLLVFRTFLHTQVVMFHVCPAYLVLAFHISPLHLVSMFHIIPVQLVLISMIALGHLG